MHGHILILFGAKGVKLTEAIRWVDDVGSTLPLLKHANKYASWKVASWKVRRALTDLPLKHAEEHASADQEAKVQAFTRQVGDNATVGSN